MFKAALLGVAVCVAPFTALQACEPIDQGEGIFYFPCTGKEFGRAWRALFDAYWLRGIDLSMNGPIRMAYSDGRFVGYTISTYEGPITYEARISRFLYGEPPR